MLTVGEWTTDALTDRMTLNGSHHPIKGINERRKFGYETKGERRRMMDKGGGGPSCRNSQRFHKSVHAAHPPHASHRKRIPPGGACLYTFVANNPGETRTSKLRIGMSSWLVNHSPKCLRTAGGANHNKNRTTCVPPKPWPPTSPVCHTSHPSICKLTLSYRCMHRICPAPTARCSHVCFCVWHLEQCFPVFWCASKPGTANSFIIEFLGGRYQRL